MRVLFQRADKLIRAGSGFAAAQNTIQSSDDFVHIHPLDKTGDTLCISAASADEADVMYFVIVNIEFDLAGACPESFVSIHGRWVLSAGKRAGYEEYCNRYRGRVQEVFAETGKAGA